MQVAPVVPKHTLQNPIFVFIKDVHSDATVATCVAEVELIRDNTNNINRITNIHLGDNYYVERFDINDIMKIPLENLYRAFRKLLRPNPYLKTLMGLHDNVTDNLSALFTGVNITVIRDITDLEAIVAPIRHQKHEFLTETYSLTACIDKETIKEADRNDAERPISPVT